MGKAPRLLAPGSRFGRWTVIEPAGSEAVHANGMHLCRCECGTEKRVSTGNLVRGQSLSCGCLAREKSRRRETQHGHATSRQRVSPTYSSWQSMIQRSTNPKCPSYARYGGRGIEVRYASFAEFLADVGERPPGRSIDRVDNDGHYEPGNCRWATPKQQRANQSPR